jgi:chromosome segregation ATPase
MSNQARISSIDALEAFRAELIRYIEHARVALEDMTGDARRTRTWLDVDRTQYWASQFKKLTKQLHQAEEELYSANLTSPHASNAIQKMAVQRAKRKLEEAEAKINLIKRWRQVYDNRTAPLLHQLEPMFAQVGQRLPKAVHALSETIKILQAYAESGRPAQPKAPADVEPLTPPTTPPTP